MKSKTKFNLKKLIMMALLCAIAIILVYLIRFPMFLPFLEYDPMDIPIIFGGLMFGPVGAITMTVVTSIIQGITVSAVSNIYGIIMHIVATGALSVTISVIARKNKSIKNLIIAAFFGIIIMCVLMIGFNLLITPLFMKTTVKQIVPLLLPAIIPFNLIKGTINTILAVILYKSVGKYYKKI